MGLGEAGAGKEGCPKCCGGFGEKETEAQRVMQPIWDEAVGGNSGSIQGWSLRTQPGTGVSRALLLTLAPQHPLFLPCLLPLRVPKILLFFPGITEPVIFPL